MQTSRQIIAFIISPNMQNFRIYFVCVIFADHVNIIIICGFAIHVKYNGLGQIIERNYMPFQDTRLALNGQIAYYNNWDGSSQTSKFNRADIVYLNRFDPSKVIEEINEMEGLNYAEKAAKYPGQVLWYSQAGFNAYPVGLADPVAEDIETDYQAKLYKNKNIRTSFTSSGMYIDYGVSESEKIRFEKQQVLTEFQGADGAGNIMYVEVEPGQQAPTFTPFNAGSGVDNRFEYHEKSVEQAIVKCFAIEFDYSDLDVGSTMQNKFGCLVTYYYFKLVRMGQENCF